MIKDHVVNAGNTQTLSVKIVAPKAKNKYELKTVAYALLKQHPVVFKKENVCHYLTKMENNLAISLVMAPVHYVANSTSLNVLRIRVLVIKK